MIYLRKKLQIYLMCVKQHIHVTKAAFWIFPPQR